MSSRLSWRLFVGLDDDGDGSGSGLDVLVDRTPFRTWSICPLCIGMDRGGWRRSVSGESPGKFTKNRFLRAVSSVDSAGENSAACENATCSAMDGRPIVAFP